MARPALLLCDSDAVIQFLLAGEVRPFRLLKKYSIQPLLVAEVEIELRSNRRFAKRIAPELKKALSHNLLRVLDKAILEGHYGGPPAGVVAATAALAQIATIGRQYEKYVDRGEAYTHAAALAIGVPAISNDFSALMALTSAQLPLPATVLRAFDLIALCRQTNEMTEAECDSFRAFLVSEREYVPKCFVGRSFSAGLPGFYARLVDGSLPLIGGKGAPQNAFSNVMVL